MDQVRVHIASSSAECPTDLAAVLAHGVRRRHPQTAPPLVGGATEPSPKLPRG